MLSKYDQPEPKTEDLDIDLGWITVKEALALIDAMHLFNKPGLERIHKTLLEKINHRYDILKWSHDQSKMQLVDYAKRQAVIEAKEEKAMSEYSDLNEDTDERIMRHEPNGEHLDDDLDPDPEGAKRYQV